jgi:nucleoside-diphosphate-sugar epimerase
VAPGKGRVAVTGATGFIGRRLVPALSAGGWRVRVLARRPDLGAWGSPAPEIITGSLEDPAALAALVDGADQVIHGAGLIKARDRRAFLATNRDGAAALARAAGDAPVLQISSLAAREPGLSDYAASKRAGEGAARAILGDRLTILRPPAIYGPGDRETLGLFQLAGASPVMPMPDAASARLALAHVDDVVGQILALIDGPHAPGPFAVGGGDPQGYGWREIFETAAAAMGRGPLLAPTPAWLIRGAASLSETLGRVRGVPAIFTPGKARELLHPDWSVARDELPPGGGVACRGLRAGFDQTVAWYRAAGWLAKTPSRWKRLDGDNLR